MNFTQGPETTYDQATPEAASDYRRGGKMSEVEHPPLPV
jgi:hypothetical protein